MQLYTTCVNKGHNPVFVLSFSPERNVLFVYAINGQIRDNLLRTKMQDLGYICQTNVFCQA